MIGTDATYTLLENIHLAKNALADVMDEMRRDAERIESALAQGTAPMSLAVHHGPAAARDALVSAVTTAKNVGVDQGAIAAVLSGTHPFDVLRGLTQE